ncbi:hypothetical protein DFP72DRAFT_1043318 [Ephemerocybe angulata]|uniref:Uncharacterized protein n=1 Tax=Ephemerocybe angulata TaxID=980116 RepID=A0A8H6I828_9AGAR|nr:hypothetical protein DFP72DRAFT_1043318 [Tulosesus angulatus]
MSRTFSPLQSHSILPFPHLSPPPLIVKLSKLNDDGGLYSSRAHCGQRRAPSYHHHRMTTTTTRPCAASPSLVEKRLKHRLTGPAFDSPTPLHRPEGCDDGLHPLTQCHNAASQSEVATEARNARIASGTRMALNSRRRPAAQNFVGKSARTVPSLHTYPPSSPGPLVADRARTHAIPTLGVLGNEFAGWDSLKDRTMCIRRLGRRQRVSARHALTQSTSKPRSSLAPRNRAYPCLRTAVSTPRPLQVVLEMPWRATDGSGAICTSRRSHGKKSRTWATRVRARRRAGVLKLSFVAVGWIWNSRHDEGVASASLKIRLSGLTLREPTVAVWPLVSRFKSLGRHGCVGE